MRFDIVPQELEMHMERVEKMGRIVENCCTLRLELFEELKRR